MLTRAFTGSLPLVAALALGVAAAATYTDAARGFSVSYPPGWQARKDVLGTAVVLLPTPAPDQFASNFNVLVQPVPEGITLAQLTELSLKQLANVVTDYKLVSQGGATVGGVPARQLEYTGTQGKFALHWQQLYALRGGKAYVLTFTAEQKRFAAERKNAASIVQSFKFR